MLNDRQKGLYEYLVNNASTKYVTKQEISTNLPKYYPRYLETTSEGNSSVYRLLKRDIQAIKRDEDTKMVISTRKGRGGYKLADKEEKLEQLNNERIQTLSKLKRVLIEMDKAGDNHQFQMNGLSITEIERYINGK